MKFEFPNLFPTEKVDESSATNDLRKVNEEIELGKNKARRKNYQNLRHNVPNWFGY